LLIEQKNAKVTAINLPEISAIPLHMSQLFGNLISNALKFSKPGVPPDITIVANKVLQDELMQHAHLNPNAAYYKIELSDNGIGFNQEYAQQIFSIFQRLHGKKDYEGTGIGLAMCQKIVQNHHGEIYASGEAGKGSRFTIILPADLTK
jgi:signal transduction histidine kinase